MNKNPAPLVVKYPGLVPYFPVWQAMQQITEHRTSSTPDQIWLLEHQPVYTLGLAGKPEHILQAGNIPVVKVDRGGQVTYHGPGQLVIYLLLDLKRHHISIRQLVYLIEETVIQFLKSLGIIAKRREKAPGVYVNEHKIAALGLKVRRGCCYHGLSLNVNMDLLPFQGINPCGYPGLAVTSLSEEGVAIDMAQVRQQLLACLYVQLYQRPLP
ncbi:lipoyl(octanoyl) transferase LipB [Candidatus Venteria ishoeyi]|uniref:Octanoyltransferase n=1 Tax=Candidatus Venteria ishoeyi TaxID=1899563 RepID=A0A1H6FCI9_9GAMM|nr:lipoyl(octanoyl) transferase LipB [Candidatus Venteria ishoeyi]SEH07800.1 Octanoyltransferase [Candidatus Venteria ishoeyi]